MTRPIRRGRLDVLDRVRPGLADLVRARLPRPRGSAAERARRTDREVALAAATAAVAGAPRTADGAAAALETALGLRDRWPGPAADRLVVAASGLVRAAGGSPADPALAGLPGDEALRLAARLRGEPC